MLIDYFVKVSLLIVLFIIYLIAVFDHIVSSVLVSDARNRSSEFVSLSVRAQNRLVILLSAMFKY